MPWYLPALFLLLFLCPPACMAQADSGAKEKTDSLISFSEKIIAGNKYLFLKYNDGEVGTYLQIILETQTDTSLVLQHTLLFHGGDCNAYAAELSAYDLIGTTLVFYTYSKYTEHYDDQNPHTSYGAMKETYVIQKKGPIVRIGLIDGVRDSKVSTEVVRRLGTAMAQYRWR